MKKTKTNWVAKSYTANVFCPHCHYLMTEYHLKDIRIENGEEFKGQIVCLNCRKFFELEIKK